MKTMKEFLRNYRTEMPQWLDEYIYEDYMLTWEECIMNCGNFFPNKRWN